MGATPRNFQAQLKILKKIIEKSTNQNESFPKKKVCFVLSTLKMKRSQKYVWQLPDGKIFRKEGEDVLRSTPGCDVEFVQGTDAFRFGVWLHYL
jgi:hypothetical protein